MAASDDTLVNAQSLLITSIGVFVAEYLSTQSQEQKANLIVMIGHSPRPRPRVHVSQPGPSQCHALAISISPVVRVRSESVHRVFVVLMLAAGALPSQIVTRDVAPGIPFPIASIATDVG